MRTFEVTVTYKGTAKYTIKARKESDIPQLIHDDIMSNFIGIEDVTDWGNYDIESFEKETEVIEEDDEPVIYDSQDGR